ncbi:MAG TPA: hypothetical protein VM802_30945 [Chitinophaga sp.]|uniref:hypothetical protein n=1 Tax=Chitinophaga sp. TaxID=1869181 RepID=UPI002C3B11FE|nr:hypothetical protein [Chitinophaga sp.]HVI49323.1 hypothetical protein [Chitinophaga sp.]
MNEKQMLMRACAFLEYRNLVLRWECQQLEKELKELIRQLNQLKKQGRRKERRVAYSI